MTTNTLQEIAARLWAEDNFIIVGHAIPDGDCIGSLVGLYLGLSSVGKKCTMFLADPVPPRYRYLNGTDKIQLLTKDLKEHVIVYLDCSDAERVGEKASACLKQASFTINIDHHYTNDYFADCNLVDAKAAATAEIVVQLLKTMNIPLNNDIATSLYTGIVMDTGKFSYSNTTSRTLRIAAELLDAGINLDTIRVNLFESRPRKEIQVLGEALQSLSFSDDGQIAWLTLSYNQVENLNALDVYPEDIINYTRMIDGVEVGISFREVEPGLVKIGFRSKNKVDVSAIAAQWGGGGHKQAAGARQSGTLEEVKQTVIKSVRDVLD